MVFLKIPLEKEVDDESDKIIKGIAKAQSAEDRTYKTDEEDLFIPQSKLYKKQFKLLRKNSTLKKHYKFYQQIFHISCGRLRYCCYHIIVFNELFFLAFYFSSAILKAFNLSTSSSSFFLSFAASVTLAIPVFPSFV